MSSSPIRTRRPAVRPAAALALLLVPTLAGRALAAPSYTILASASSTSLSGSSPLSLNNSASDANGVYYQTALASPGEVLARTNTVSVYGTDEVRAYASTGDFIITGPPNPSGVSVTVHFMLELDLEHSGPLVTNSISGQGWFDFYTNYLGNPGAVTGDALSGNDTSYGDNALAGYGGGAYSSEESITTSLPVGQPFQIGLTVDGAAGAYAGACNTLGQFAGQLGDATGKVMDLPPGYTVNSVSWGVVNNQATGTPTAVSPGAALELALAPATPNPSVAATTLAYTLPRAGAAALEIYDVGGRLVRTLASGEQQPGAHALSWDGRDAAGRLAGRGLFFARLSFGGETRTKRITRL